MDDADSRLYSVVVNHEGQYSIWPSGKQVPPGWTAVGQEGEKAICIQYIEQVWTDMRPATLRARHEAGQRS